MPFLVGECTVGPAAILGEIGSPASIVVCVSAGVIHRDLGNLEHAATCYLSALQIRPNFPQVGTTVTCRASNPCKRPLTRRKRLYMRCTPRIHRPSTGQFSFLHWQCRLTIGHPPSLQHHRLDIHPWFRIQDIPLEAYMAIDIELMTCD